MKNQTESNSTVAAVKQGAKKVKKSTMFFLNEKTGNVVGYLRALQLHITKTAKMGYKNPKTGRLVTSIQRARMLGLA